MKKAMLLAGAGLGFVLGSRAGRGPYEQLESKVRKVAKRSDVQQTVAQVKSTAKDQVGAVKEMVGDKLPGTNGDSKETSVAAPDGIPQGYADPQDLEFTKAAAAKEEMLDAMLGEGISSAQIEATEEALLKDGDLTLPRVANQEELADGTKER